MSGSDAWRNQLFDDQFDYGCLGGIWLKRSWGGNLKNVEVLAAICVEQDGYRQILGVVGDSVGGCVELAACRRRQALAHEARQGRLGAIKVDNVEAASARGFTYSCPPCANPLGNLCKDSKDFFFSIATIASTGKVYLSVCALRDPHHPQTLAHIRQPVNAYKSP